MEKTRYFPKDHCSVGLELALQIYPEQSSTESCMLILPSNLNLRPRVFCTVYVVNIGSECFRIPRRFQIKRYRAKNYYPFF